MCAGVHRALVVFHVVDFSLVEVTCRTTHRHAFVGVLEFTASDGMCVAPGLVTLDVWQREVCPWDQVKFC